MKTKSGFEEDEKLNIIIVIVIENMRLREKVVAERKGTNMVLVGAKEG